MTLVSLTSELLWQRNDAITFFTCLCISRHREIRNRLKELVPPLVASIMAQFEQIQRKRFRNISKQSFKGHKNGEKTFYQHNWLTFEENDEIWKCSLIS